MIHVEKDTIYAGNKVNEALLLAVRQLLECYPEINVSFDVIGRTKHECLAHELYAKLDERIYGVTIEHNYVCKIRKLPQIFLVTIKVCYKDINGEELVYKLKRAFTRVEDAEMLVKQGLSAEPDLKKLLGTLYVKGDKFTGYGDIGLETIPVDSVP